MNNYSTNSKGQDVVEELQTIYVTKRLQQISDKMQKSLSFCYLLICLPLLIMLYEKLAF